MTASRIALFSFLALAGCEDAELEFPGLDDKSGFAGFGGGGSIDSDGDGVPDDEEAANGTDPNSADTDLDGWSDSEEVERNTDPTNGSDKPYEGGWPIGDCRDDVSADSSLSQGGIAPNFELVDTYGDTVALHDFCHMAVLVVTGAEWCGPCQSYRADMASLYDAYFERGLMVIDFLGENASGGEPSNDDLVRWADGHHYAVVGDPGWAVSNMGYVSGGIPAISLLGPGAEVVSLDGSPPSTSAIEAVLPSGFEHPDYYFEE
jgi:thiol-disulfide isomerase/thioredoxin